MHVYRAWHRHVPTHTDTSTHTRGKHLKQRTLKSPRFASFTLSLFGLTYVNQKLKMKMRLRKIDKSKPPVVKKMEEPLTAPTCLPLFAKYNACRINCGKSSRRIDISMPVLTQFSSSSALSELDHNRTTTMAISTGNTSKVPITLKNSTAFSYSSYLKAESVACHDDDESAEFCTSA